MQSTTTRFQFVDLLRGLAALSVAVGHLTLVFLKFPSLVARITMAEPTNPVAFPEFIDEVLSYFTFASVGVGVFFLISGFVIALSLDRLAVAPFLVQRFFRIFPTYWVAFGLGVTALFVSGAFWSKPVTYDFMDYFSNTFLISDFFARYDILTVMWTLQIEIKFYLLIPFFHKGLRKGSVLGVLLWTVGLSLFYWYAATSCGKGVEECWSHYRFGLKMVLREAAFITFMLIGSIFYAHFKRVISSRQAVLVGAFLFVSFLASAPFTPFANVTETYRVPFAWGLAIFLCCYLLRDKITLTPAFRFLADISYPLYVVHPLVGYVTIRLALAYGLSYSAGLFLALALVIAAATAIHLGVESPLIALGKRLTTRRETKDENRRPAPAERDFISVQETTG